jgi:hypothetical protein
MPGLEKVNSKAESESLLLVEGVNDCHAVFQLMWLIYGCDPHFGIHECGNDERVLDSLAARLVSSTPKQKTLGVLLDADIDGIDPMQVVQSRFDQLKSRVGDFYAMPDAFPENGLILSPRSGRPDASRLPRLGVWLMPDNRRFGMFEDLLVDSLPPTVASYTSDVVKKSKADGIARFKDAHLAKATIRTFLAWQDPPDIQYLGLAIKKGMFEHLRAECDLFIGWLGRLFGLPSVGP